MILMATNSAYYICIHSLHLYLFVYWYLPFLLSPQHFKRRPYAFIRSLYVFPDERKRLFRFLKRIAERLQRLMSVNLFFDDCAVLLVPREFVGEFHNYLFSVLSPHAGNFLKKRRISRPHH